LFQNPVGFGTSSWKNRSKPGFSAKFKEAVPKAEVLEQPQIVKIDKIPHRQGPILPPEQASVVLYR
jgi:hypothetical protein